MIAMIVDSQFFLDQVGDALGGPQLGAVAIRHRATSKKTHESGFLLPAQPVRSTGSRLGLQSIGSAGAQGITPTQNAAGVAADAAGNLMQRQTLLEKRDDFATTTFQCLRRPVWSHGDNSFPVVSILLHYLCGSQ